MDLFATRYMTRFSCIGPRCEDNCCHSWGVPVDRKHYDLLREKMASPEEQDEFLRTVRVHNPDDKGQGYSMMVLQNDGRCSMLDDGGMCKVHARYGEEVLSNTCATYPRVASRLGDRFELVGSGSCPEVARLILLGDDAMEMVPVEAPVYGRGMIARELDKNPTDNYRRSFYSVRSLLTALLRVTQFSIGARLFFVAFFADKTRAWLRNDAETFDGKTLFELMQMMRQVEVLQDLDEQYARIVIPVPFALSVIRELLLLPAKTVPVPLQELIGEVTPLFAERGLALDGSIEDLWHAFEELRPTMSTRIASRVDRYVERYAQQYLLREWFVTEPSLMQYVMGLLARVAVVRFLLLCHPTLRRLALREDDEAIAELDALAVRVVYALSRMLEHDEPLADRLINELEEQSMTRLEHAVCLTKI